MLTLMSALLRMISHSAEWMNPMPPMSAASWYTSGNPGAPSSSASNACRHCIGSRKSSSRNSSAAEGPKSGGLRSTPRTRYPSALSRLTRCPAMKPPAPHTSARFITPRLGRPVSSRRRLGEPTPPRSPRNRAPGPPAGAAGGTHRLLPPRRPIGRAPAWVRGPFGRCEPRRSSRAPSARFLRPPPNRSSESFSPGRRPVNTISMSRSTSKPERRTRSLARSTMRTGSPISSMNVSPPFPRTAACNTSCTASGMVMK